ncbi:MAG TPA: O-methyltransferase [Rhizomicrobium sp.]|jgi:DNA-binding protein Fis
MKPSTASFISYDLRPAKQAERRILLDFLKCANEAGIPVSDCRYVGMGATKFYDFHLLHRFLGIDRMISLERDPDLQDRAEFNCPYDFISVVRKTATEFLASDLDRRRTIYWLDYEDGIGTEITGDIIALGTRVMPGGFAFVTVYGDPPGVLRSQNDLERLEFFQSVLGDFSEGLTGENMQNANFAATVHHVVQTAFRNAFAPRQDGEFKPLFNVQYQDSSPMVTVGGCFCTPEQTKKLKERLDNDLSFLSGDQLYKIRNMALTERERRLFDLAVTKRRSNSAQANKLRSIGFKKADFESYKNLIRFLPRYYESII